MTSAAASSPATAAESSPQATSQPTAQPTPQPVGILLAGGRGVRYDPSGQCNKLLAPLIHGAQPGVPIALLAAQHMRAVLARVIAVVRPDGAHAPALARLLEDAGCEVLVTAAAQRGMGASLAAGVRASLTADTNKSLAAGVRASLTADTNKSLAAGVRASLTADTNKSLAAGVRASLTADTNKSLAAAVSASNSASGWVIALADMPALAPATIAAVSAALLSDDAIAAAWYRGVRGHPVGFGRAHGVALAQLDGDTGARALLNDPRLIRIDTEDAGVLRDVDSPDAL